MKLDQHYSITPDSYNTILRYEKEGEINEKTGRPKMTTRESYHANLSQALEAYVEDMAKDELRASDDALSILKAIDSANANIRKLIKTFYHERA